MPGALCLPELVVFLHRHAAGMQQSLLGIHPVDETTTAVSIRLCSLSALLQLHCPDILGHLLDDAGALAGVLVLSARCAALSIEC